MTTEVEEALRELKRLFPNGRPEITLLANATGTHWKVRFFGNPGNWWPGQSLAECMSQARAWKQENRRWAN